MKKVMNKHSYLASLTIFMFLTVSLTGCETTLNEPATGALAGGAAGAGLGAIIGSQSGHTGAGTAIGAGSGALLGALVGEGMRRSKESAKKEIKEELRREQMAQQGYGTYQQPAPQGYTPQAQVQQVHTKYNPKTGQTFPENFTFDPVTGDELKYLQ
jgi:phage tail tape-measure protein